MSKIAVQVFVLIIFVINLDISASECEKLPGSLLDAISCCSFPDVELDEATMSCMHEVDWDKSPLYAACSLHNCHATKSTILVEGNEINKTALFEYVAHVFKDNPEWIDITSKSFESCVDFFQDKQSEIMEAYKTVLDVNECNPTAMTIETCGFMYVFKNCPQHAWTENQHCLEWKTFAENCGQSTNAMIVLNDVSMDDLKEEVFV